MRENTTYIRRYTIDIFGWRFGVEYSFIYVHKKPYLERWILYAGGTVRLHRFHSDDDYVLHDHPWWFVTFPLGAYYEAFDARGTGDRFMHRVRPFRFHFRPALYRHRVILPGAAKPWTIVITGTAKAHGRPAKWGFYPTPDTFVPFYEWSKYTDEQINPAE